VGSCLLDPFLFLYPPRDHSPNPSHLSEDGLGDNNPEDVDIRVDSLDDSEVYYFLADSFGLPKPNQLAILYELFN